MRLLLLPALSLIAGAFAFSACKKSTITEETTSLLSGTYTTSSTITVEAARMYTVGGSTTDTAVIGAFMRRMPTFGLPAPAPPLQLSGNTAPYPYPDLPRIDFGGNNTATFYSTANTGTTVDILSQTASLVLLGRRDSSLNYSSFYNRCEQLSRAAILDHSDSTCFPIAGGGNSTTTACRFRQVLPIEVENGTLYMPLLSVMVRSANGGGCWGTYSNYWNRFNAAMLPQLGPNDTLVVQRKRAVLQRQ